MLTINHVRKPTKYNITDHDDHMPTQKTDRQYKATVSYAWSGLLDCRAFCAIPDQHTKTDRIRRSVMLGRVYWTVGLSALNWTNNIKPTVVYDRFCYSPKFDHIWSNCLTNHLWSDLLCSKKFDYFLSNILINR